MNEDIPERAWVSCDPNGATYKCMDKIKVYCKYATFEILEEPVARMCSVRRRTTLKNGILWEPGIPLIVIVNGTQASRDMKEVISGGPSKTYAFPNTTTTVGWCAFQETDILSVRLNEGLKALNERCFYYSGIRKLTLSSSVELVDCYSFSGCEGLRYVDLSAAHGLKSIDNYAFW